MQQRVKISRSALEACKEAEAVVIATEWKEFRDIDWNEVYRNMKKPAFVFDGRILLDADKLRNIGFKVSFPFLQFSPLLLSVPLMVINNY